MARSGTGGSAALDFTDGDTLKRFTIADVNVQIGATITPMVQRPNAADADDLGWIYVPNVVSVGNGSFDVLVAALAGDGTPGPGEFPNETVTLAYLID